MLIVCKKRKNEQFFYKKECVNYTDNNLSVKKHKILHPELKRKLIAVENPNNVKKQRILERYENKSKLFVDNKNNKIQKIEHNITKCLIHEEEYICDIYNCSGVKNIKNNYQQIPYII